MEILYILGPITIIGFVFAICKWILGSTVEIEHIVYNEEERLSFDKSAYFCRECEWQGNEAQLYGIFCPWCQGDVVEHYKDGYHCPQGMRMSQKRLKELHESDL